MNRFERILELFAVGFSVLFTVLYQEGLIICYLFALLSASTYLYLCFRRRIYAESLLQLFYIFTAGYGFQHWLDTNGEISASLNWSIHGMIILAGFALLLISGYLLSRLTDAANPYVDSFTTVFSIFATLLMIYLIPENWWYWVIIDAVSVWLYFQRKMYFTTLLFIVYTALAVKGVITSGVY